MENRKALADYSLHDLPNLVVAIIEDKLKLYAAVFRVRDLYFLPSTTPIADAIPEKYIGENGNIKKEYLAAQGCYAISDTNPLIRQLESIYKAETHPDSLGRVRAKRVISLKHVVSQEGVHGYLVVTERLGYMPGYEHNFAQLPFTRILVEEENGKRQTELDYVLSEFLKKAGNAGGAPALYRFMVDEMGAEFLPGNKFRWTDPTGEEFTLSKKRLVNRLSELRQNN